MLSVSLVNSRRTRVFIACGSDNDGIAILEVSTKRSVTPPKAESAQNGPIVHPCSRASGFVLTWYALFSQCNGPLQRTQWGIVRKE